MKSGINGQRQTAARISGFFGFLLKSDKTKLKLVSFRRGGYSHHLAQPSDRRAEAEDQRDGQ